MHQEIVKSRIKGNTVVLSLRKYLTLGQDYIISSPSPFAFEIRPNTNPITPRNHTLVASIVRIAIRDGNSVVLALKKFLVAGDECIIHQMSGYLLIIRKKSVEIEKYIRHLAALRPALPTLKNKEYISKKCPKCGSNHICRADGNFACNDCKYTISAPVPLNQNQLSYFFNST